jgi:hypothetical protein
MREGGNYLRRLARSALLLILYFGRSIPSHELDLSLLAALEILCVASLADLREVTDFCASTTAPCFFLREFAKEKKIKLRAGFAKIQYNTKIILVKTGKLCPEKDISIGARYFE